MADRAGPAQHIPVNVNTSGSTQVVAGVAGMDAVLININLISQGANIVTLEDGVGMDRIGPWSFAANGGISMPDSNVGWTRFGTGQSLNIRLSLNVRVAGSLSYRMVPEHFRF